MKLHSLNCPNCNGSLEIEDGIDTFFCKYCGNKIVLEGQSKEIINAKVKVKEFQHQENIQKTKNDLAKYKIDAKTEYDKRTNRLILLALVPLGLSIISIVVLVAFAVFSDKAEKKEHDRIESQIVECINNGDYDMALVYAKKLDGDEKDEYISIINSKINENIEASDLEIPISSKYAKGKNYEEIVKMLEDAGFTNISLSVLEDDAIFFKKTDQIDKITIDGNSTFDEGTVFKSNVKIIVYYYK